MCLTLFFKYVARPGVGVRTVQREKNGTPIVVNGEVRFHRVFRVESQTARPLSSTARYACLICNI